MNKEKIYSSFILPLMTILIVILLFLLNYNEYCNDILYLFYHKPINISLLYIKSSLILLVLFISLFGLSLKINYDKKLIYLYIIYFVYGFFSILFDKFYLHYSLMYSGYLFYTFYNLPLIILLISSLKLNNVNGKNSNTAFSNKIVYGWLAILFSLLPLLWIIGTIGHFYNINILGNDGILKHSIIKFGHKAITTNGVYLLSIIIILISILLFSKVKIYKKIIIAFLLLLITLNLYWTYARIYYVGFIAAVFFMVILYLYTKYNKNKIYKFLLYSMPAISFTFSIFIILAVLFIRIHGNKPFSNSSSLYTRLHEWQFIIKNLILTGNNYLYLLFGHGIKQYGFHPVPWVPKAPSNLHLKPYQMLFDNTYVEIIAYNGVISLILFFSIYIYIWRLLLKALPDVSNRFFSFYAYVIVLFAAFPAMFMFGNLNSLYNIYGVLPVFIMLFIFGKREGLQRVF